MAWPCVPSEGVVTQKSPMSVPQRSRIAKAGGRRELLFAMIAV